MEETTDDEAAGYRPRPCSGLRQELLECLRESDCVKVVNNSQHGVCTQATPIFVKGRGLLLGGSFEFLSRIGVSTAAQYDQ